VETRLTELSNHIWLAFFGLVDWYSLFVEVDPKQRIFDSSLHLDKLQLFAGTFENFPKTLLCQAPLVGEDSTSSQVDHYFHGKE